MALQYIQNYLYKEIIYEDAWIRDEIRNSAIIMFAKYGNSKYAINISYISDAMTNLLTQLLIKDGKKIVEIDISKQDNLVLINLVYVMITSANKSFEDAINLFINGNDVIDLITYYGNNLDEFNLYSSDQRRIISLLVQSYGDTVTLDDLQNINTYYNGGVDIRNKQRLILYKQLYDKLIKMNDYDIKKYIEYSNVVNEIIANTSFFSFWSYINNEIENGNDALKIKQFIIVMHLYGNTGFR